MKTALEQALEAVARLRGDPSLDAEAWRLLRAAVRSEAHSASQLPSSTKLDDE